jgi:hypothetical protein
MVSVLVRRSLCKGRLVGNVLGVPKRLTSGLLMLDVRTVAYSHEAKQQGGGSQ